MKSENSEQIRILIEKPFRSVMPSAATRAQYLFPSFEFAFDGEWLQIDNVPACEKENVSKELNYLLYREKVREEFAPFRREALARLFGVKP